MSAALESLPIRRLSPAEAATLIAERPDLRIFDVRDAMHFKHGHLQGACNLSPNTLQAALFGSAREHPVLIYCYHGISSQEYARTFVDFGFTEVCDLIGGFHGWQLYQSARARGGRPAIPEALRMWLCEHGFPPDDIKATIDNGTTPLMVAARQGESVIADLLLDCGAAIDQRNDDGNTALWLACFCGDAETIAVLIERGANLDNQNDNGATCLMYAASAGKTAVLMQLLAAGADTTLRSLDEFTALDMAATLDSLRLLRGAMRMARCA